jgi:hypothetical protein
MTGQSGDEKWRRLIIDFKAIGAGVNFVNGGIFLSFDEANPRAFSNGLAAVKVGSKWGFIDVECI